MPFELPAKIPAMILPNIVLFPGMLLPLFIFEARYRRMLDDVLAADRTFAVVPRQPEATGDAPAPVGCLGLVRASVQNRDGTSHLFLLGCARVRILGTCSDQDYPVLQIKPLPDTDQASLPTEARALRLKEIVRQRLQMPPPENSPPPPDLSSHIEAAASAGRLADLVAHTLIADPARRLDLLSTASVDARLTKLIAFLMEKN